MALLRPAAPLPDPQDNLLEVSFRRLLDSCFKQLETIEATSAASATSSSSNNNNSNSVGASAARDAGANSDDASGQHAAAQTARSSAGGAGTTLPHASLSAASDDSDRAAAVLKMRHFVDTLREQLSELRAQQEALGIDAATLDLYDTHVKAVAAAVPKVQLPPYCQKLVAGSAAAAAAVAAPGGSSSRVAPNLSYFTPPPARPGVPPAAAARSGATAGTAGAGGAEAGLSEAATTRLREAEAAQALLTDELAELTAALKANARGMAGAVSDRGRLLDATEAALDASLAATKRNVATAKEQVKRSGGNLCFTCMVLLVVGLVFTAMVVYIKFTHLLGYKAGAPAAGSGRTDPWATTTGGNGDGTGWQHQPHGGGVDPWGREGEL